MHARFTSAFSALPAALQSALQPLLDAADFHGVLRPQKVAQLQQATGLDDDALALALLPIAACCAVAPVSHFNVGAIARGISGHWYFGANMEFLHAQRCSKRSTPSRAQLPMPGCRVKRSWRLLLLITRRAGTAASL